MKFRNFHLICFSLCLVSAREKKKNIRKQTEDKPFMCTVCGTGFIRKFNLERHENQFGHKQIQGQLSIC